MVIDTLSTIPERKRCLWELIKKLKSLTTLSPPSLNCMEEQPDLDKQKKRHLEKQEYEQAYEQAYKEAYAEGVEIGSRKVKIKAAIYLLTKDYSIEDISEMTKLDVDTVKELAVKK